MRKALLFFITAACMFNYLVAQPKSTLTNKFEPAEYNDVLMLGFRGFAGKQLEKPMTDSLQYSYQWVSTSEEVGLCNKAEFYLRNDNVGVLNLRGTIAKPNSWIENFFAGMVKATGALQVNDSLTFNYQLASDENASVHIGWLLGLASMSPYINHTMDSLLANGVRSFIVMGHSQGGALAFLTTSYLHYKYGSSFPDLILKSYCSAAPKPGNLYYAYDFDRITKNGFGYRIVNTSDWVPESPLGVQTINDFNEVNPLKDARKILKKQSFFVRLYLTHVYNKMDNASARTMKRYRKYLGGTIYKQVKKSLPQFKQPNFVYGSNYMTAGCPIILHGDSTYNATFKFDGKDLFVHHMLKPYLYLLNQEFPLKK